MCLPISKSNGNPNDELKVITIEDETDTQGLNFPSEPPPSPMAMAFQNVRVEIRRKKLWEIGDTQDFPFPDAIPENAIPGFLARIEREEGLLFSLTFKHWLEVGCEYTLRRTRGKLDDIYRTLADLSINEQHTISLYGYEPIDDIVKVILRHMKRYSQQLTLTAKGTGPVRIFTRLENTFTKECADLALLDNGECLNINFGYEISQQDIQRVLDTMEQQYHMKFKAEKTKNPCVITFK